MEKKFMPPVKAADELTIKELILKFNRFISYLVGRWKAILLFGIIGAVFGLGYSFFRKTTYTAECTFVLQEGSDQGSLGQYSAIASMVGIDVGGSNGLFQGENIIELYKSRTMLEKTLLTPVAFGGTRQLLIDRYIIFNKLREAWKVQPRLQNIRFDIPKSGFTTEHDSLITQVVANLLKRYIVIGKPDKKLSIISVKTNAHDPLFAKAFTETLVANVNSFYIQTKTKGVLLNLNLLKRQSDSIRSVLNSSISGSASSIDENPYANPNMQLLKVPSQKKQIDVQSNSAIYAEVSKNLEIARGMLQRETPLIQIIDQPVLPLPNDRTGKLKLIITGGIIGSFLGIFLIAITKMYRKLIA